MALDPFYPIFDSSVWLERLLPLGIRLVQLRIKDSDEQPLRAEIRRARELCARHQCQLIVNDHWRLAIEEGCDFVHLGQEDLDEADLAAIRQAGLKLGVSSHDEAELDRALAVRPDYIALGPVYPTILKKMKWEQQGLERLTTWKARIGDIPLVAIGGMNVERAPGAFAAGADIVSVVTDITLNADPEARVKEWIAATREYLR
ncbi:thiamine phosphate synthase [Phyllobacterium salinisoli]|uniref:Thiamine-phosphate synthase n=2 Tax=Phyllobacterium salinisoli TaxID=1899321 RepID=A0A368K8N1_9HYPH|nr:thiamine phosphate synthase [Phyllobacterium salinisoli]